MSTCPVIRGGFSSSLSHIGNKIGNAHLKWAFSKASLLMPREHLAARIYVARLENKHGKAKAISILSARLRTVYWMLKHLESFDEPRYLK
jgi:hypothetical protein